MDVAILVARLPDCAVVEDHKKIFKPLFGVKTGVEEGGTGENALVDMYANCSYVIEA